MELRINRVRINRSRPVVKSRMFEKHSTARLPQEPGESQDHPPEGASHAEEVDEEEDDGAGGGPRRLVADDVVRAVRVPHRIACDRFVAHDQSDDVADADHHVTRREEDDRSLGVTEVKK